MGEKKNKKKKTGLLIAEIVCVIVIVVCVVLVIMQLGKYKQADDEFNQVQETFQEEYDEDIDRLETDNPNCVGWVSVADTRIDYPVMYTPDDPEYYLHRNFEGQESSAGTPFLGKGCLLDGNSSIIYGHHMNDGSMFATLTRFDDAAFGTSHTIEYKTVDGLASYVPIAAWYEDLTSGDPYRYWDQVGLLDEAQFDDYVANIKRLSRYDTGVDASYGDTLLALSTCSYGTADERFIVVAVKQ